MSQKWILSVRSEPLAVEPDKIHCREITAVAKNSPASELGLKAGDLMVDIDTLEASKVDLAEYLLRDDNPINYVFVQPDKKNVIFTEVAAIPLGLISESTSSGIVDRCQREGFSSWDELSILWRRRQWQALHDASVAIMNFNLQDRIMRIFKKGYGINAEGMYQGAALYEMGQEQEGINLIHDFIDNHISNHDQCTAAIALFYAAKWADFCGDKEGYEYWLSHANQQNGGEYERINQEVAIKNNSEPQQRYRWKNKIFPVEYNLPSILSNKYISLEQNLEAMQPHQLLPVCVMPSYRGNGPYNTAIMVYRGVDRVLRERLMPMQVITDTLEKRNDRQWWYSQEEYAIESGVPIDILYDENSYVNNVLDNNSTPIFYLLSKDRTILYEGVLQDDYDYWETLNDCAE